MDVNVIDNGHLVRSLINHATLVPLQKKKKVRKKEKEKICMFICILVSSHLVHYCIKKLKVRLTFFLNVEKC